MFESFFSFLLQSTNEFIAANSEILQQSPYNMSSVYIIAFDVLWTLALVLNKTEEIRLNNDTYNKTCSHLDGELVPLNEFNYSNAFMGSVMKENYKTVNFTGVLVSSDFKTRLSIVFELKFISSRETTI